MVVVGVVPFLGVSLAQCASMKIHSGQPVKMVQSAAPPCKDEPVAPTCSHTPESHSPHCQLHRQTLRGLGPVPAELNANSKRQQQRPAKPQGGEPQDVLDYRECWHLLHDDDVHRQVEHKVGTEKSEMSQEPTAPSTSSRGRATEGVAMQEQRQNGSVRGGQWVRHYRKQVSVRWGNLQCSLALVLVVRSRSSSGSCHCACDHCSTRTSSTLTVA